MRNSGVGRRKGQILQKKIGGRQEKFWCMEEEWLSSLGEERRNTREILV